MFCNLFSSNTSILRCNVYCIHRKAHERRQFYWEFSNPYVLSIESQKETSSWMTFEVLMIRGWPQLNVPIRIARVSLSCTTPKCRILKRKNDRLILISLNVKWKVGFPFEIILIRVRHSYFSWTTTSHHRGKILVLKYINIYLLFNVYCRS